MKKNKNEVREYNTDELGQDPAVLDAEVEDAELDSDGFVKSDGNFDLTVSQINAQKRVNESVVEPDAISSAQQEVDSDGFWKSSNSEEFDKLAAESQVKSSNVLKDKNGRNEIVMRGVGDDKGRHVKLVKNVGNVALESSVAGQAVLKDSRETRKGKLTRMNSNVSGPAKNSKESGKINDSKKKVGFQSKKKKRRVIESSDADDDDMVPSHEAEKILFRVSDDEELDSGEVFKGKMAGSDDEGEGDLERLSQEIKEKAVVDPVVKSSTKKTQCKKTSAVKASTSKPSGKTDRVKVAPIRFFGQEPDRAEFGYLDEQGDNVPVEANMEFMFGRRQKYSKEYNVILSDNEFEDENILDAREKDRRDSDNDDYLDSIGANEAGPSGLKSGSKRKLRTKKTVVSSTQWGPTQEIETQNGTKHAVKIGMKMKQSLGKQGTYARDQRHSISL